MSDQKEKMFQIELDWKSWGLGVGFSKGWGVEAYVAIGPVWLRFWKELPA